MSVPPCLSLRFNGRYKLWWHITSLYMCVCQHMWVERCTREELFLFKCVGRILYVFISVLENLSGAFESDREGEKPTKAFKTPVCFCTFLMPPLHLFLFLWKHDNTLCPLIAIFSLSPHTWSQSIRILLKKKKYSFLFLVLNGTMKLSCSHIQFYTGFCYEWQHPHFNDTWFECFRKGSCQREERLWSSSTNKK